MIPPSPYAGRRSGVSVLRENGARLTPLHFGLLVLPFISLSLQFGSGEDSPDSPPCFAFRIERNPDGDTADEEGNIAHRGPQTPAETHADRETCRAASASAWPA